MGCIQNSSQALIDSFTHLSIWFTLQPPNCVRHMYVTHKDSWLKCKPDAQMSERVSAFWERTNNLQCGFSGYDNTATLCFMLTLNAVLCDQNC